jgi:hypothetical protein
MGEETVGPLNLPRPQKAGCALNLVGILLFSTLSLSADSLAENWAEHFGWAKTDARILEMLLVVALILSVWTALISSCNRSNPRLSIRKNETNFSIPTQKHFELWTGETLFERAMPLIICFLLALMFSWGAFFDRTEKTLVWWIFGLSLFICIAGRMAQNVNRPLLVLDEGAVFVRGRRISWKRMQYVEIEH